MKLAIVILFFSILTAQASSPELPRLFFSYSWLYDSVVCEEALPEAQWIDEAKGKTESFSQIWSIKGPELFNVIFDHTGLGFSRKEMTATLSVCPKKPSYSDPLVLNVTRFLNSYMSPTIPYGDDDFVDLVFHELLHTWVVENLEFSQLRRKYRDEVPSVRSHLHLMAIQKFVYLKLQRPDLVEMLDRLYIRMGGTYGRAWEIVQIEGHEAFIREFPVSADTSGSKVIY